jgi:uncharacterized flavoprotein (TIGR03862 family)
MTDKAGRTAAVIGGGPAGLMAAETLARAGVAVVVYDRMPSAGRKFLLAGRGGLNLTHSEPLEAFLNRYHAAPLLRTAIAAFPPGRVRAWCEELGQPTFVGSSGRVFPRSLKTSPLLRAWLRRLDRMGVAFMSRHLWTGWDGNALTFETPQGRVAVAADAVVLALGGASWPQLGSDGGWVSTMTAAGIAVAPLRPANCGFTVAWSEVFRERFQGHPLKRIALSFAGERVRGEAVVTVAGIEGGAVYALSAALRDAIAAQGEAVLYIDLRPDLGVPQLTQRLAAPRGKQSMSSYLRKAGGLAPATIGLMHETALAANTPLAAMTPDRLAEMIKSIPLRLTGVAPLSRAISTAGGVAFSEIDENFMLKQKPGVFVAGEMLDWEVPTGGYLLQGAFATGVAAAWGALAYINRDRS